MQMLQTRRIGGQKLPILSKITMGILGQLLKTIKNDYKGLYRFTDLTD